MSKSITNSLGPGATTRRVMWHGQSRVSATTEAAQRQSRFAGAPAACVLLAACGGAGAQDVATIYGRLNVAIEGVSVDGSDAPVAKRLSNNRSVLGFRGTEDLGDGLQAIWQLEGALSVDTGTGSFTNRDTRVGLAGPAGTLFVGIWTLPYTLATSSYDPFYPTTAGYMGLMGNGSAASSGNVSDTAAFDRRQKNVVQYWTPTWKGISARVAYSFNEEIVAATGAKPSLFSGSVSAQWGRLAMTLAHEVHRQYQAASGSDTGSKIGATYAAGNWKVSGVAEHLHYQTATGGLSRNSIYVSGTWKPGAATTLNAGFAHAFDGSGTASERVGGLVRGDGTGASQLTVGADYAFSKRAGLFVYVSHIANRGDAAYDFAINQAGVSAGQKPTVVALGLRHAF